MLYERAWGAPKDYDPKTDEAATRKPRFDPSLFSPEQLAQIEATLRLVAATQPAEAESPRPQTSAPVDRTGPIVFHRDSWGGLPRAAKGQG
jgi:hypothetical protein